MNQNDLKPDLGLHFSEKFNNEIVHHFYAVQFIDILHVDNELYSFTAYPTIEGTDYAATFDFKIDKLNELIKQIEDDDFTSYLNSTLIKTYSGPEKAAFYEMPMFVNIEAVLGEPVKSKYETFVPFVVKKFSNVER